MKKLDKLLFICASVVLLAGCRFNDNGKKESNANTKEKLFNIEGKISSDTNESESSSSRTAVPTVDINGTGISYTVIAKSESSQEYQCTVSGTNFYVSLPAGVYTFEAVGTKNFGTDASPDLRTVLKGSQPAIIDADGVVSLKVYPLQSSGGSGTVNLPVSFDETSITDGLALARAIWYDVNNEKHYQDLDIDGTVAYFTFEGATSVPSGSYTVLFYFVHTSTWGNPPDIKFCCSEVINVYDNCCTDKWVNTGNTEYFGNKDGEYCLLPTQVSVDSFGKNKFVSSIGYDDNNDTGSLAKPYRTIAKAVSSVSSQSGDVIIYLLSDVVENGAGSKVTIAPSSTDLRLQIQSLGMNQWTENGVTKCEPFCVDLNDKWFELGNSITQINPLKIKDLKIIGGKSSSNDEGIFLDPNGFCKISAVTFGGYIMVDGNKTYANDGSGKPMKRNLYLKDGAKIKIFDALDARSRIGVSLDHIITNSPEQITVGYNSAYAGTGAIAADPNSIFFSDSEDALCGWNSSKTEVVMAVSKGAVEPKQIQNVEISFPDEWQQLNVSGSYATRPAMRIKLCDNSGQELASGSGSELYYKIWCTKKGDKTSLENEPDGHANGTTYTTGGIEFTPSSASNVLPQDYAGVYTVTVSVMYKKDSTSPISPLLASKDFTYWYEGTGKPLSLYAKGQEEAASPSAPAESSTVSIYTKKDMEVLRDIVNGHWKPKGTVIQSNFDNVTVNLMTDVSLDNEDWEPIGLDSTNYCAAKLFGNNHSIKDFKLPLTYTYNGLFGYFKGYLQDLNVIVNTKTADSSLAECSQEYVGGIVGYLYSDWTTEEQGVIHNCSSSGKIELKTTRTKAAGGSTSIGGIVGWPNGCSESNKSGNRNNYKYTLSECKNYAEISITTKNGTSDTWAEVCVGGIAGCNSCISRNCENYGKMLVMEDGDADTDSIYPVVYFAGIAGKGTGFLECKNYGLIKQTNGNNACISGIVAQNSTGGGSIHNCENYGNIISEQYPDTVYTYKNINTYTAGIVAYYSNGSYDFENCVNNGEVYNKGNCTGGIVGKQTVGNSNYGFKSLKNTGRITGYQNVGGIAGYTQGTSSNFTDCVNYGEVCPVVAVEDDATNTCDCFGGIIGCATLAKIESCINKAKVTGSHNVGGIVGQCGTSSFYCVNSINAGPVTGKNFVGGILGTMQAISSGFSIYLYNCLNSGAVEQKGTDGTNIKLYAAGIFNDMSVNNSSVSKVYNCVNTGSVTSKQFAAGIANVNKNNNDTTYNKYYYDNSSVKNCYYLSGSVRANDGANGGPGFHRMRKELGSTEPASDIPEMFMQDNLVMVDKVDTFINKYYIEDSEIKYRYVSPMYGAGPLNSDDVVGCLNNFINTTTISNYTLKHWYYNSNKELDFIPESESITPVVGKKGFVLCEKGSTSTNDITVDNSFYICTHEVTQAEYEAVMGSNPSYFSSNPAEGEVQENRPVENVSWFDALVYCNKRSVEAGLTPYYKVGGNTEVSTWGYTPHTGASIIGTITTDESANGFRLPTVSEWKYAASGGKDATPYTYSGSGTISEVAWYVSNSGNKTHEVMKCSKANKLGLYDMSGNVLEWCWDPPTEGATTRIRIGGYWKSDAGGCVIKPDSYNSNSRESQSGSLETCGFRVVRNTY